MVLTYLIVGHSLAVIFLPTFATMGTVNNKGMLPRRRSSRLLEAATSSTREQELGTDKAPTDHRDSSILSPSTTEDSLASGSDSDSQRRGGCKRKLTVTPSPRLDDSSLVATGSTVAVPRLRLKSRSTLPLNVHDLDANPTRRLLPIRSEPEDENTLFIQSYGQDFYSSLMSRDYYIDADKARQNGLRVEERYMVVSLLAGIVIQRNLTDSTLHLAVQLMTRYFALDDSIPDEWTREKYIIVASIACFLVAHKVEEVDLPPLLKDEINIGLLEYCNNTRDLKKQDVLDAEMRICCALGFALHKATPLSYIDRFIHASVVGDGHTWPSAPNKIFSSLLSYLVDVSLFSDELVSIHSSLTTAAAVYLSRCTLGIRCAKGTFWSETLAYYTGYEVSDLRAPVILLRKEQCKVNDDQKNKFWRKYRKSENNCVALKAAPLEEMLFPN